MADPFEEDNGGLKLIENNLPVTPNLTDDLYSLSEKLIDDQRSIITTFELYDLEIEIRKLKRTLESWREIVLPLSSVLKWEKNWYPGAILGGTTLLFLVLWLLDPSILTTFSLLALTLTISDYLVPVLISSIYKPDSWTAKKELEFEGICRSLVIYKTKLQFSLIMYYKMRTERPKLFYLCTIVTLVSMAYVGNLFNNLFLTYIFVTATLLVPGLLHNGLLQKYGAVVTQAFSGIAENLKNKVGHAKKE